MDTEDKDRAGTLDWDVGGKLCDDSSTSLGGILIQRPEIPEPGQQQLVAARGQGMKGGQDIGRGHSPPGRRGAARLQPSPTPEGSPRATAFTASWK